MVNETENTSDVAFVTVRFSASLPKAGSSAAESEDRFLWKSMPAEFRVALADGASQSLLSGEWAELLVQEFCTTTDSALLLTGDGLLPIVEKWRKILDAYELPWYAQAKKELGAHTTFVGVDIRSDRTWIAQAVGDSCVFQVRDSALIDAFPFHRHGQFSGTPHLIGTSTEFVPAQIKRRDFTWTEGDDLYLMSDALAEWFLHEVEQKREPWRWLEAVAQPQQYLAFPTFIEDLRARRKIQNDDVTILHLRLGAGAAAA